MRMHFGYTESTFAYKLKCCLLLVLYLLLLWASTGVALMIFESGMHFDFEKAKAIISLPAFSSMCVLWRRIDSASDLTDRWRKSMFSCSCILSHFSTNFVTGAKQLQFSRGHLLKAERVSCLGVGYTHTFDHWRYFDNDLGLWVGCSV